ncbi:MAG: hypothetical protein HY288_01660 [Planctomycetia bacterium]|nr:hypothetical protein [Planctomycetia bacterium]
MFPTNTRGRNRELHGGRISARDYDQGPITEADFYLAAGKTIRRQLRRGHQIDVIARALDIPLAEGLFALRYAGSSPALILRALVENWSWTKIKRSVGQPMKPGVTKPLLP